MNAASESAGYALRSLPDSVRAIVHACNSGDVPMTGGENKNPAAKLDGAGKSSRVAKDRATKEKHQPDWAQGLQKLYSSVVDEPLPDMFQDLLRKLDGDNRG